MLDRRGQMCYNVTSTGGITMYAIKVAVSVVLLSALGAINPRPQVVATRPTATRCSSDILRVARKTPTPTTLPRSRQDSKRVRSSVRIKANVTAYCTTPRRTSWPASSRGGTCAVDPRHIPYGSMVRINGRWYRAIGRHGKSGRVVDVWMPSRSQCMRFGRQRLTVEVVLPAVKSRGNR